MNSLAKFEITPRDGDFLLRFEDDEGGAVSLTLTAEQLDALIDAADELLDEDDTAFEADEDDDSGVPGARN
ncbi:MAG: hypothetical protein JNK30_21610 [Phenylobacterium sp.]|uniref:hypothetical protein n=1 Tax=Phenylobacterium sp. TaxID=1871053 RepID=UPI001A4E7000|nr:hypothetical protein [Phenylobacterium sp.]MBL8773998.1 hypothetical protein [Phenylobacterium sp.]